MGIGVCVHIAIKRLIFALDAWKGTHCFHSSHFCCLILYKNTFLSEQHGLQFGKAFYLFKFLRYLISRDRPLFIVEGVRKTIFHSAE